MNLDLDKILKELEPYREKRVRVIDLQNHFHRIVQPILKNLLKVIRSFRQKDIPILFTPHGHTDPPADGGVSSFFLGDGDSMF